MNYKFEANNFLEFWKKTEIGELPKITFLIETNKNIVFVLIFIQNF